MSWSLIGPMPAFLLGHAPAVVHGVRLRRLIGLAGEQPTGRRASSPGAPRSSPQATGPEIPGARSHTSVVGSRSRRGLEEDKKHQVKAVLGENIKLPEGVELDIVSSA